MIGPIPLRLDIQIDLSGDAPEPDMGAMLRAFNAGALLGGQFLQGVWIRVAGEMDIRSSGAYIRGISENGRIEIIPDNRNGPGSTTWDVVIEVTNTAPHASIIEDGHAAFSMVDAINWNGAGRIKRTADGRPYLHIPFRHAAYQSAAARASSGMTTTTLRSMMPENIYAKAKNLKRTQRLGVGPVYSPSGQFLAADRYRWGGRLDRSGTSPAIIVGHNSETTYEEHRGARLIGKDRKGNAMVNPAWQNSKFHGMFKTGGEGHSQYMTIRTITPDSKGWNIPAMAGLGVARRVGAVVASSGKLDEIVTSGIRTALGLE